MICNCPRCAGGVQNRPDLAGRVIACPYCGYQFPLPPLAVAAPLPMPMPPHLVAAQTPHPLPAAQAPVAATRPSTRQPVQRKPKDNTAMIMMIGCVVALPLLGLLGFLVANQSSPSASPAAKRKPKSQATATSPVVARDVDVNSNTKRQPTPPAARTMRTTDAIAASPERMRNPDPIANYESASDSVPFDTLIPNMPSSREVFAGGPPTRARFESIKVGTEKAVVFELLGPVEPFATSRQTGEETFIWGNPDRGQITVVFKAGKVASKTQLGLK